jgi:glycosyltransferase involved in cell wall biosynthesis
VAGTRGFFYRQADAVTAVSEGVARDLAKSTGVPVTDIEVIHNPVITPEIRQLAQAPVAHPWFAPGHAPVVLGMGRLKPQKNFALLISSFARVRRQRDARLVILGRGPERAALEIQIEREGLKEDVEMPGFVVNPYPYLARAAAFVLSSNVEGLPGALIEAMGLGCPVVSTDCESGPREILLEGRLGELVPIEDQEAMTAAILRTLESPPNASALVARADEFSPEVVVPRYRRLLGV